VQLLVTGAGGQLGQDVSAAFARHEVTALAHDRLDVTDRDQVLGAITTLRPQAIVHCAAWTAVDACEADPDRFGELVGSPVPNGWPEFPEAIDYTMKQLQHA